jgi:hypothetical protein
MVPRYCASALSAFCSVSAVNVCEIVASFGVLADQLADRVAARELLDERRPRFLVADLGRHWIRPSLAVSFPVNETVRK